MTVLRRVKTLENYERKRSGFVPFTMVKVDGDGVYYDREGAILTKNERGAFYYEDGAPLDVPLMVVVFNAKVNP